MQSTINQEEISMLRSELELLMRERHTLLRVAGAAAGLVAELDSHNLPQGTAESAELLAANINTLTEETLKDALGAVHAAAIN